MVVRHPVETIKKNMVYLLTGVGNIFLIVGIQIPNDICGHFGLLTFLVTNICRPCDNRINEHNRTNAANNF